MFPKFYLILLVFSLHTSCRTTLPSSSDSHSKSTVTQIESPANFRFFSFKKLVGEKNFEAHAKSIGEFMCESICSDYELASNYKDGVLEFAVVKKSVPGKTSPGFLDKVQKIEINPKDFKKIILKNFAKKGHSVEIAQLPSQTNEEFIFALGRIVSSMGIGGESSGYQLSIGQKSQVAAFKDQSIAKQLTSKNLINPKDVLVSGIEKIFEGIERGSYQVFEINSLEFIEIED